MSQYGDYGMAKNGAGPVEIAQHYYTGADVGPTPQPSNMRIQIRAATASTVVRGMTAKVGYYAGGGQVGESQPGQDVTIAANGDSITLDGTTLPPGDLIVGYNGSPLAMSDPGHQYKDGHLRVVLAGTGTLQLIIEDLTMEQYMYGLAEVPSSWPDAALQAQALAGRSYAKYSADTRRAANPGRIYDLDASTIDQVYVGYDKERGTSGDRWVAAVNATAGQTITYGGNTIQAFYSSSSGGHTENSEYVFSATVPYLRGVDDPDDATAANPNFRWTRTYSGTELQTWVRSTYGVDLGPVSSVQMSGTFGVSGRINRANVRLTGPNGSKDISGSSFSLMINRNAGSRQMLSTLILLDPFGSLDGVSRDVGGVRVRGWTIDPNTTGPLLVQIQVDVTTVATVTADGNRPDIGAAYPAAGPNHGYDTHIGIGPGFHNVCARALNVGGGGDVTLGCRVVNISNDPTGSLDVVRRVPGSVLVAGWSLDPDTADPIKVHTYVDGTFQGEAIANRTRNDVGAAAPPWGPNHGFQLNIPMGPGAHQVCSYGINVGPGTKNPQLGCRTVTVASDPMGSLDGSTRTANSAHIKGWSIDPDTTDPIKVHLYVDNQFAGEVTAAGSRPDVGNAFPGYGSNHGYEADVNVPAGRHTVCAYGINVGPGTNRLLGCTVPAGAAPIGNNEGVIAAPSGAGTHVKGWAIDPDTASPIKVHLYIDGAINGVFTASGDRPDVGAAYPSYGSAHGFDVPIPAGSHQACVYAINDVAPGPNILVGCVSS
jgi:SpoIID/LytB domain protein